MADETLADAAVRIVADFDTFEPELKRQLNRAVRAAARDAEKEFKRQGRRSARAFADGVAEATQLVFRTLTQASATGGRQAGEAFGQGLQRTASRAATRAGQESGNLFSEGFRNAATRSIGTGLFNTFVAGAVSAVTAASPLSTVLGGAAAAAVALAGALAQAAGAGIALGGVLGSLGLAGAAVAVGFQGVGDAVKAQTTALQELNAEGKVSEATQKKLDAALKNLSPNAAATVRQLAAMAPAWERVRRVVQDNLFQNVAPAIRQLGARFLPDLQTALGAAAARLNATGVALARFFTAPPQARAISAIFDSLNRILGRLLPAIQPVAAGLLTLFRASLPFAEQLATVLGSYGPMFDAFAASVTSSGAFTTFLENAFTAAQQLLGLLGNLGRIIGSIFSAGSAAGVTLLSTLENLTGELAEFLASAQGQEALASFFGLIGAAGSVLVGIFSTLQPLLSGITTLFAALQGPLRALGTALLPVVNQLATTLGNTFRQLAPVMAQLITALTPLVTILGTTLAGVLQALLPVVVQIVQAFATLAPQLTPIIQALGTGLVQVAAALVPLLTQLVPLVVQLAQAFLTGLTPVIQTLVPIIPQLVTAVVGLLTAFLQLVPAILPLIPPLAQISLELAKLLVQLAPLIVQILAFATMMVNRMGPAITTVVGLLGGLVGGILSIVQGLTTVIGAVGSFVSGFLARFNALRSAGLGIVSSFVGAAVASFGQLAARAVAAIGRLVSGVVSGLGRMVSSAAGAMGRFAGVIQDGINRAVSFIATLPGRAASAVAGLGSALFAAGAAAVQGLVNGIQSRAGAVLSAAQGLAARVRQGIGGALKIFSPSRVTREQGENVGQGLIDGIRAKIPALRQAIRDLGRAVPDEVEAAIGRVATALRGINKALTTAQQVRLAALTTQARAQADAIGRAQDALNKRLQAAQGRLNELLKQSADYAKSVFDNIVRAGSVVDTNDTSFAGIVDRLKNAVTAARDFNRVLQRLQRAGLNRAALDQIAQAGPEAGTEIGRNILAAGARGINQINRLQAELNKAAQAAAKTAADAQFANGIRLAQGVVAGLQRQRKQLELQMTRLADVLVARIISVLKLRGPGRLNIPGFANGGLATRPSIVAEDGKPEVVIPLTKPRRRDELLERYFSGWDGGGSYRVGRQTTIMMPIQAGTVVDPESLARLAADQLDRRFGRRIGIDTAGGKR